jgi:hypothetical protein
MADQLSNITANNLIKDLYTLELSRIKANNLIKDLYALGLKIRRY